MKVNEVVIKAHSCSGGQLCGISMTVNEVISQCYSSSASVILL